MQSAVAIQPVPPSIGQGWSVAVVVGEMEAIAMAVVAAVDIRAWGRRRREEFFIVVMVNVQ